MSERLHLHIYIYACKHYKQQLQVHLVLLGSWRSLLYSLELFYGEHMLHETVCVRMQSMCYALVAAAVACNMSSMLPATMHNHYKYNVDLSS